MDWICFMIDYETMAVADGRLSTEDLTLCCLLNESLTDSFVVSGNVDNQSFMIQSIENVKDFSLRVKASESVLPNSNFSIQSNFKVEKSVSVRYCSSTSYAISNQISDLISITVALMKHKIVKVKCRIKHFINNMKGRHNRFMVYTLCLLRL